MVGKETSPAFVELRPGSELGTTASHGLVGTHHFCFATYQRPDRLEWGALRCLNRYRLPAGEARDPTFHSGFEIVTLVSRGRLARLGTFAPRIPLPAGSAELVSAGAGVQLGALALGDEAASYTELWIVSDQVRIEPRRRWRPDPPRGLATPFASGPRRSPRALRLDAAATICLLDLRRAETVRLDLSAGEFAYLVVESGALLANGVRASAGDGLAAAGSGRLVLEAAQDGESLLVRTGLPR